MFDHIPFATILVSYVAVLFSLSVHEAAHAAAARLLGDDTAARQGRLTLNPLAHMDILGTLILPLLGMITGARVIGWAKPVPVDATRLTRRFRNRVAYAMVAAAGPVSNLLQSFLFLVALGLYIRHGLGLEGVSSLGLLALGMFGPVEQLLKESFSTGQVLALTLLGRLVIINIGLAIFNLVPVGPLDGAGILRGFLPFRWLPAFDRAQPTISIVILVLFLFGVMGYLLMPLYSLAERFYLLPLARLILGV